MIKERRQRWRNRRVAKRLDSRLTGPTEHWWPRSKAYHAVESRTPLPPHFHPP